MGSRFVGLSAEYAALVTGKVGGFAGGTCTLLGPEGPGADGGLWILCWCLFLEGLSWRRCFGGWGGYRPYFENYTVDASIFHAISCEVVWCR